jgi:hypothetical protein
MREGYHRSSDVAREIFEEIEECFFEELVGCTEAKLIDEEMFAELKKKYTQDKGRDKIAEFGKYSPLSWRNTEEGE